MNPLFLPEAIAPMKPTSYSVPEEFDRFAGLRPWLDDPFDRAEHMSFTLLTELMAHEDTPFGRLARNGLLLNEGTESFLYDGKFGFISEPYKTGSRPVLEKYIGRFVTDGMSDGEKAIALSQSLQDLPKLHPKPPAFLYGESDEETILKGGGHCSCRAKVLVGMCQVLGIQARPALMWAWKDREKSDDLLGGHTVAEIFIDGEWGFFDPQHHLYARTHDGSFPSILKIRKNPEIFYDMPADEVIRMDPKGYPNAMEGRAVFEYYWYKNFHYKCPISITTHDVNAVAAGPWNWATTEFRQQQQHDYELQRELLFDLAEKGELTEEIYWKEVDDFRAFSGVTDWQLRTWKERSA